MTPSLQNPLAFTQLLLSVIDDGRRTATYKLAVILALVDCCALSSDEHGRAATQLATRGLAGRVAELYWPQVRPYAYAGGGVLRQSTQLRAITVQAVAGLRRHVPEGRTFDDARRMDPEATDRCLDDVELNLVRMPLGRLQRPSGYHDGVNACYPRFLYDDAAFHAGVSRRMLERQPIPVRLRAGVGDYLVSLAGLLRPLLEMTWTREVARINRVVLGEDHLHEFLFGASRAALSRLRPGLSDAQSGSCFYCAARLRPGDSHVDHFIPWSKVPNDALTNLVLTDGRCNASKSDDFPDLEHLQRWSARSSSALATIAREARWPLRAEESFAITRSVYGHLPPGTRLWSRPGVFGLLDQVQLRQVLAVLHV